MASERLQQETTTKDRFYKKRLLGQLAVREKKVTQEQLDSVIREQIQLWENGQGKKIGQLFVEHGLLSSAEVHELLKKQDAMDRIRKRTFKSHESSKSKVETKNSLIVKYKAGDVIFEEGDDSHRDLYVIQSGEIGVYRNSIFLGKRFEQGAFLGTISCLLKTPRAATAVAVTDSCLLRIPEVGVQSFFSKNPHMSLKLSSVLAQRLLTLTEKYVHEINHDLKKSEDIDDNMLLGVITPPGKPAKNTRAGVDADQGKAQQNNLTLSAAAEKSVVAAEKGVSDFIVADEDDARESLEVELENTAETHPEEVPESPEGAGEIVGTTVLEGAEDKPVIESDGVEDEIPAEGLVAPVEEGQDTQQKDEEAGEVAEGEEDAKPAGGDPELDEDGMPIPIDPINEIMQEPDATVTLPEGELKDIVAGEKPLEFTDKIRQLLDKRLEMYLKLDDVGQQRNELEEKESTGDRAKNELASLRRELNKIPPYDPLKMKCDKLADMIAPPDPNAPADAPAKPQLTKDVIAAYEISVAQKRLLLNWYDSMGELTEVCAEVATEQLLYKVLLKVGVNPVPVFGWAVYAMAMNEYLQELREEHKGLRADLKKLRDEEAASGGGGLLKMFKKKQPVSEEEVAAKEKEKEDLEAAELKCRLKTSGITKELAAVEVVMVDAFWAVYGALGVRLVKGGVTEDTQTYVRGYLRWGILGLAKDFMDPELLVPLLDECKLGVQIPEINMENNYILYADEIIELTAKKKLLPSPNEELELNERNSPRWKADRAHRRVVGGEFYMSILQALQKNLIVAAEEKRAQQAAKEKELADVADDDPDKKKKTVALKRAVQALKVAAVKSEKLVERAQDDMMPKIAEDIQVGKDAFTELGFEVDQEELARHEIICIRRFCRLVAKLKEPFLPFTLRDKFNPSLKTTNTKADVQAGLEEIEKKDSQIFKENMLATMKKNNRVQIRSCPFIHLLPASGGMGFLVSPRTDTYSGKLLVPAYFERTGQREDVMVEIMSDFRYDTSKEQAGNDVMNSDTLVAAYAEVRWILRKKDKDVRQKAGIFTDENERTNWRRHYAMYINSAYDSGKQLFFKCPDLYELIINKFIELPEGIEILKRG